MRWTISSRLLFMAGADVKKIASLGLLCDENVSMRALRDLLHVAKTSRKRHGGVTPTSHTERNPQTPAREVSP